VTEPEPDIAMTDDDDQDEAAEMAATLRSAAEFLLDVAADPALLAQAFGVYEELTTEMLEAARALDLALVEPEGNA